MIRAENGGVAVCVPTVDDYWFVVADCHTDARSLSLLNGSAH